MLVAKRMLVETKATQSSLDYRDQLKLISEALDSSEDGFSIWRPVRGQDQKVENFILLLVNDAGAKAAGVSKAELIGKSITSVVGLESSKNLSKLFQTALSLGHSIREVVPVDPFQGLQMAFENTVVPFGKDLIFSTYRDVSEQERERTRLLWLSEHDYLTGMPNRAKLRDSLIESAALSKETGLLTGFAFIDIDHFKNVNDTYGHDMGDAVLVNFVKRVRNSLPASALVARISGDEFAILLNELDGEFRLRDLMSEVFAAMNRPFRRDDEEISITCSAGCVLVDGSVEPEEIMRIADKAMYRAKHEGRNRFLIDHITATM